MYEPIPSCTHHHVRIQHLGLHHVMSLILPSIVVKILFCKYWEYRIPRLLTNTLIGIIIGQGLYYIFLDHMIQSEDGKIIFLIANTVIFGAGWAFCSAVRCTTMIMGPSLISKSGRTFLISFAIAALITGPLMNLVLNARECVRSVTCTVQLQVNHTKLLFKTAAVPLKDLVDSITSNSKSLEEESNDVEEDFSVFRTEVKDMSDFAENQEVEQVDKKDTQKTYSLKTKLRCYDVFEKAVEHCKTKFSDTHKKCMETIWVPIINHILCVPLKFDFLCGITHILDKWCENNIPVAGNFGNLYDTTEGSIDELNQNFEAKTEYKVTSRRDILNEEEVSHMIGRIDNEFDHLTTNLQTALNTVEQILAFSSLFLLLGAVRYTWQFNSNIQFDNIYISRYFRIIDAKRRLQKKRTLLPMKQAEDMHYINPLGLKLTSGEKASMVTVCLSSCMMFVP
uniref:Dendritic cell-specific transmembrane protein-like domain-containing protein n=1 Tax=Eptatretus burgeri TaxID=7764 RepID=A0A8C4N597_EPTBU